MVYVSPHEQLLLELNKIEKNIKDVDKKVDKCIESVTKLTTLLNELQDICLTIMSTSK